jgi:hypothetical protein
MAIKPSSSPLFAFATYNASENEPIKHPYPFLHLITKAAEQRFRYNSQIYNLSVTATRVLSRITSCSQLNPPVIKMLSHNHVLPQECNTSRNVCGVGVKIAADAKDVSRHPLLR